MRQYKYFWLLSTDLNQYLKEVEEILGAAPGFQIFGWNAWEDSEVFLGGNNPRGRRISIFFQEGCYVGHGSYVYRGAIPLTRNGKNIARKMFGFSCNVQEHRTLRRRKYKRQ